MVHYHYAFKNAVGAAWNFVSQWSGELETSYPYKYVSAALLSPEDDLD